MCFVWIWEQTAIISLYNIKWLVFMSEVGSVFCAVRAGSLTKRDDASIWKANVYEWQVA